MGIFKNWSVLVLVIGVAGCGNSSKDKKIDDEEETNAFFPTDLSDAVDALREAVGPQADAGSFKLATIANRHSNYWTPVQIGTAVAATELGCFATFDATDDGLVASQQAILEDLVAEGYAGIAVAPLKSDELVPVIDDLAGTMVDHDGSESTPELPVNIITFDTDADAGSERELYVGTINYEAGFAAGTKMVELLGEAGGKVAALGGLISGSNAQERVQGIYDSFEGTNVELVDYENGIWPADGIDPDVARQIVVDALADHADLKGIIGIFGYNGPTALTVLEEQGKAGDIKLIAFDLESATIAGLKAGTIQAALAQRPYWMGVLSIHVLFALQKLGVEQTKTVLAPWIDGDLFSTGQDVVTPDDIGEYEEYLTSLGLSNG